VRVQQVTNSAAKSTRDKADIEIVTLISCDVNGKIFFVLVVCLF